MNLYSTSRETAIWEFYEWYEAAEGYLNSAIRSSDAPSNPKIPLGFLQLSVEYACKAVIMSIGGNLPTHDPYVLSTRCRRLVPALHKAARLYAPDIQQLFFFLDPAYYQQREPAPRLPLISEWKKLVRAVKQFLRVLEILFRERVERLLG